MVKKLFWVVAMYVAGTICSIVGMAVYNPSEWGALVANLTGIGVVALAKPLMLGLKKKQPNDGWDG